MGLLSARRGAPLVLVALLLAGCAGLRSWLASDPRLDRWRSSAEALRGLEFLRPFELVFVKRAELPELLSALIDAAGPPSYITAYRDAYAALGAWPRDFDLRQRTIELQQEQLLGLYDPDSETLYVVDDALEHAGGSGEGGQLDATMVHELVHALQHQHFPQLFGIQQSLRHNDDLVSALAAAIEGDASLTMLAQLRADGRSVAFADQLAEAMLLDQRSPQGMLADVPRLIRASLLFGYTHGTPLAARRYALGGNAGLDELLGAPPLSTREARDPDDGPEVEFVTLPLESLATALEPRGCRVGHDNVAGALTIGVLFEDHEGEERRPGLASLLRDWRGDRFVHVVCGEDWELAWLTRWRSGAAARAFATRYRAIASSVAATAPLSGAPSVVLRGATALVQTPGLLPEQVLLLEAGTARSYRSLAEWIADDCFSESPCGAGNSPTSPATSP